MYHPLVTMTLTSDLIVLHVKQETHMDRDTGGVFIDWGAHFWLARPKTGLSPDIK